MADARCGTAALTVLGDQPSEQLIGIIGEIRAFAGPLGGKLAQAGWLECNGQALDQQTYLELFGRIELHGVQPMRRLRLICLI